MTSSMWYTIIDRFWYVFIISEACTSPYWHIVVNNSENQMTIRMVRKPMAKERELQWACKHLEAGASVSNSYLVSKLLQHLIWVSLNNDCNSLSLNILGYPYSSAWFVIGIKITTIKSSIKQSIYIYICCVRLSLIITIIQYSSNNRWASAT